MAIGRHWQISDSECKDMAATAVAYRMPQAVADDMLSAVAAPNNEKGRQPTKHNEFNKAGVANMQHDCLLQGLSG